MLNILDQLLPRWRRGETVAVSTVVGTQGSAPLPLGSAQLAAAGGEVFGSVSGGCVEGAVYETNLEVLDGSDPRCERYGYSDADAWEVGLTCGGTLEVFTERINRGTLPWLEELAEAHRTSTPVAVATVIRAVPGAAALGSKMLVRPGTAAGSFGDPGVDAAVLAVARQLLEEGRHGWVDLPAPAADRPADGPGQDATSCHDGASLRAFVQVFAPKPRLLVFGAIDFAGALATAGAFAGYRVTICDAREVFIAQDRFPQAHDVVHQWPHEYLGEELRAGRVDDRTAICVLTHDSKFDVPLLDVALRTPQACYIGAMGSRRTHQDRWERLQARGLEDQHLARLHSPIGLDLGGSTPAEAAISIVAEIIAHANGRSGAPLRSTDGAIQAREGQHAVPDACASVG